MRQFFIGSFLVLSLFITATPVYAASRFPLFDIGSPIVPQQCKSCPCGVGGALEFVQNLMNVGISIGILMFLFVIVYAGFLFIMTATNPEGHSQAKKLIFNAVIGFVIVLAAWLIVDFIMKIIYNGGANGFGPWNQILSSDGSQCIEAHTLSPISGLPGVVGAVVNGGGLSTGGSTVLATGGTGSCNPSTVQQSAARGGYQISAQEANILACLARPESACGANTSGARTSSGNSTSAAGPWQILLGASDKCHSLNIPACGNLNCSAAYSGGRVKPDRESQILAAKCQAAANNLVCSASAAACLVQADGGSYGAWTGTGDGYSHSAQRACVGG